MKNTKTTPLDDALWAARCTGYQLAQRLGVNESQVSRWRRGVNIPVLATQRRIAELLSVSTESLWPPEGEA